MWLCTLGKMPATGHTGLMTSADLPQPRALVVDDEAALADLIRGYLERDRFAVKTVGDGALAIDLAREFDPDVVVLDLGLPSIDGVEVCRQIRTFSDCYIVMVTARAEEVDTLIGLSVGADDYVVKPFRPRELAARIQALMRRPRTGTPAPSSALTVGSLTIDLQSREVRHGDALVALTRTEFDLLAAMAQHPRRVFTREALIREVWNQDWVGDDHLVDVHVLHIRQKLGDSAKEQRFVRTVRGVGYRMGDGA